MISFINKKIRSNSNPFLNIFMQTEEPATKEGIWIKKASTYNKVIIDDNVLTDVVWKNPSNTVSIDGLLNGNTDKQLVIRNKLYLVTSPSTYKLIIYEIDILTGVITNKVEQPMPAQFWRTNSKRG